MNLDSITQAVAAIGAAAPHASIRRPSPARATIVLPWDEAPAARTALRQYSGATSETRTGLTVDDDWFGTSLQLYAPAPDDYPYLVVADTVLTQPGPGRTGLGEGVLTQHADAGRTTLAEDIFAQFTHVPFGQTLTTVHPAAELLAALIRDATPRGRTPHRPRTSIIIRESLATLDEQPELIAVALAETRLDQAPRTGRVTISTGPAASAAGWQS